MVTHFSRATLSSESARSPIVTYVKLEMSAVLYFNCRSISVHNNVKRKYWQNVNEYSGSLALSQIN